MKLKFIPFLVSILFVNHLQAQTTVPALITSNQIWTPAGSPYLIGQNTLIDTGISVKVMPGTEIKGSGNYTTLYIDGEFQLLGNRDSLVKVSGLIISYSDKCKDYDPTTGNGAYMKFADIKGTGVANKIIDLKSTSFTITNSNLYEGYYAIYAYNTGYKKSILNIDSCNISGVKGTGPSLHQGTVIYVTGDSIKTYLSNSTINYGRYVQIWGYSETSKNTFHNLDEITFYQTLDLFVRCNQFKNLLTGVTISVRGRNSSNNIYFQDNTLDSCATKFSSSYMFKYDNLLNSMANPNLYLDHNNFLEAPRKVDIYGTNSAPTSYTPINMQQNYWGSTDSATITGWINDYNDNINIFGRVDFSNYLSTPNLGCSDYLPCPTPNFGYTTLGTVVSFIDSTIGSGAKFYMWKFGDGSSDTTQTGNVIHDYSKYGTYDACLFVVNSNGNVCDSICKTINVVQDLSCQASFYVAKDTSNKYNMFIINDSKNTTSNTTYTWSFGDGGTSQSSNPTHNYQAFGNYLLCLNIYDANSNCNSTFCDTIGMDSNGKFYKTEGFTIRVLNENDITGIKPIDVLKNISIYPNPSNGKFVIAFESVIGETVKLSALNHLGQAIYESEEMISIGKQAISIDLNDQSNGIYFIRLSMADFSQMYKVSISK